MAATLLTKSPTFHALTGTQAVGRKQIAVATDYAGSVTVLYRTAPEYWVVVTRDVRDAFTDRAELAPAVAIWHDGREGRYVVDYFDRSGRNIEADRTRSLRAAIGVAASVSSRRWAESR